MLARGALRPGAMHRTVLRGSGGHAHAPQVGTRETPVATGRRKLQYVRVATYAKQRVGARGARRRVYVARGRSRIVRTANAIPSLSTGFPLGERQREREDLGAGNSFDGRAGKSIRCAMIFRPAPAAWMMGISMLPCYGA